ncbi:MAG: hypothetical protein EOM76_11755 [Sphingobacteriia bacterium]|nr:hypothetical protein [Sphingobacteriia bacterium]
MNHITAEGAKGRGWTVEKYYQYQANYKAWAKACWQLLANKYGTNCIIYDIVHTLYWELGFNLDVAQKAFTAMKICKLIEHQGEGYAL